MTELFMAWLGEWGPIVVFCVTFLSCLAIPIPSSIVMLTAGGFAASGDLSLAAVAAAALVGAVLGDNAGYWLARGAQSHLTRWITTSPARTGLYDRAGAYMDRWGGSSVFFSCWLVAPLGPWMNYLSGITRFRWPAFALWGLAGEIVWVSIYMWLVLKLFGVNSIGIKYGSTLMPINVSIFNRPRS